MRTTNGTRCCGTRSLRRFFHDSSGCAVCVVGLGGHTSCTVGSDAAFAVEPSTSCRCVSAIVPVCSLTTLPCHKESASCVRISSRGVRIAVRSGILRPLSRLISKLEASTVICCWDQFAVQILFGLLVLLNREIYAKLSCFLRGLLWRRLVTAICNADTTESQIIIVHGSSIDAASDRLSPEDHIVCILPSHFTDQVIV